MRVFGIAVVGCGGVSGMHFRAYSNHPDRVNVVAACDPDPQRLTKAQEEFAFEQAFDSLEEMISNAQWEVAVVCTPTPVRQEIVSVLASAGKHVFIEKPMADSLVEAESMVASCAAGGVKLAVNQNFRYHFPFNIARGLVAEGLPGKVLTIAHMDLMWRQDKGWRTRCRRHALSVMGVHWLDGFRWMLADEASGIRCRMHSSAAIDCAGETDAVAHIDFESGTAVSYVQSFSTPMWKNELYAIGEHGTLVLGYEAAEFFEKGRPGKPAQRWENLYAGQGKSESAFKALDELLTALEEEAEPTNSGQDNLKTIALLEGAYRSSETGRAIAFKEGMPA